MGQIKWVAEIHRRGRPLMSEGCFSLLPCGSYQLACEAARKFPLMSYRVLPIAVGSKEPPVASYLHLATLTPTAGAL